MPSLDPVFEIYLITNSVNGRRYIGVTGRGIQRRLREHFSGAANGLHNGRFYRAIRKYGKDSFSARLLRTCFTRGEALMAEIELIAALKPEYNSTMGGDGQLGRKMSKRAKAAIAASNRERKTRLGSKLTDAHKAQLREIGLQNIEKWKEFSHLGPKAVSRKVRCLDDGMVHDSASAAARHYEVPKSAVIELCLNRRHRKTVGGKRFEYVA